VHQVTFIDLLNGQTFVPILLMERSSLPRSELPST
jgi:hypothetical protein